MKLIALEEGKDRLSIDFDTKDETIASMINGIEGYLYFATGVDFSTVTDEEAKSVAKEYVLLALELDYYNKHTELDDLRLTRMLKQLQNIALVV